MCVPDLGNLSVLFAGAHAVATQLHGASPRNLALLSTDPILMFLSVCPIETGNLIVRWSFVWRDVHEPSLDKPGVTPAPFVVSVAVPHPPAADFH